LFLFSTTTFTKDVVFEEPEIPTEFTFEGVTVSVPEGPPKPIEVPEPPKDKTGDLFASFGIERDPAAEEAFVGLLGSADEELKQIYFRDIPIISLIPLPGKVKNILDKIVMRVPKLALDGKGGFSITGQVDIFDFTTWGRIVAAKDEAGSRVFSIVIRLPKTWKFSDFFPKTKKFDPKFLDLLEFHELWFALSSSRYVDPVLEREVREGINLFGTVSSTGPLFEKLDKLFGGRLAKAGPLDMQGAIGLNPQLIGSMILIDLPTKVKFARWLETTPLKMIIAVESLITQQATPVIAFKGGLNVLFPLQKKPVELSLTGKYIFPEDLEFYAEMDGWIRNAVVPNFHVGDMRFGIVVDLVNLLASEGSLVVSGLNTAFAAGIMESYFSAQAKGAITAGTGVGDLTFIFEGTARLKDLVGFWFKNTEGLARIFDKNVLFYEKFVEKVPNVELEDFKLAFVPRETFEEDRRIEVQVGNLNLFGWGGKGRFFFSDNQVSGNIFVKEIVIGPKKKPLLRITGTGQEGVKGLVFDFMASPLAQYLHADCTVETPLLGGIKRGGEIEISAKGFELKADFLWSDLVDAHLHVKASLLGRKFSELLGSIDVKQTALNKFADLLSKAADDLLGDLQGKLKALQNKMIKDIEEKYEEKKIQKEAEIYDLIRKLKKKEAFCKDKYSKRWQVGLRRMCELVRNVPALQFKLVRMQARKDIGLNLEEVTGKIAVQAGGFVGGLVTIPLGQMMRIGAKIVKGALNVKKFSAEASLEDLAEGKPLVIKEFVAEILGHTVTIKDQSFKLDGLKELLMKVMEKVYVKEEESGAKTSRRYNIIDETFAVAYLPESGLELFGVS